MEPSGLTVVNDSDKKEGKRRMTKAPIGLQDLRKRIYIKAKAEPEWRFWGLYVHVCKLETLQEAFLMAKRNDGAPGIDGVTFAAIEQGGVEGFLEQIRNELVEFRYLPLAVRKKEIPKDGGNKLRVLSIPAIRDRVVQGALKLILEPIFEPTFNRGRMATGHNGRLSKRCCAWRKQSREGRSGSSISTSRPTSIVFGTMCF